MSLRAGVLIFTITASICGSAAADEPLPPPRITSAEPYPPIVPYRVSQYEVWQHLAVDRQGRYRPRVVSTPQGYFYSYSGEPYPWTTASPQRFMPYVQ